MAKRTSSFACQACGAVYTRWQGRCDACGGWSTIAEESATAPLPGGGSLPRGQRGKGRIFALEGLSGSPEDAPRIASGIAELDRVTGGGFVRGSVILLGGEPGIGKSTLLMQACAAVAGLGHRVVYISGEEAVGQVRLRAERLGLASAAVELAAETNVEDIVATLSQGAPPRLVIIDSIQTMSVGAADSSAGSVSQLRECTAALVRLAKSSGTAVWIVGHVTKEGAIAGPRMLEHLVDTVLYFERDDASRFRMVRATKNRFGAANELGFFLMTATGIREVRNPAAIFLARSPEPVAGSVVLVTRDGTRPLLVEVQGLVDRMRFGQPRRVTQGLDAGRLAMLLAVLNRHAGLSLQEHDVFANVVGGLQVDEPAWDLPVAVALVSSLQDIKLPGQLAMFGEVGLTGEVRPVSFGEERIREAAKLGFTTLIVPRDNLPRVPVPGIEVKPVSRIEDALRLALGRQAL